MDRLTAAVSGAPAAGRRHAIVPHTADAGFTAVAPTLPGLFEEAAVALAEMTADVAGDSEPTSWSEFDLEAPDLPALAFDWLNALIGEGEIRRGVLVTVAGLVLDAPTSPRAAWRLRARAGFRDFGLPGVLMRRPPKSATFHGLAVQPGPDGWTMIAYLDM